jgi:calcium/calmodulin-dependent protein kinase I
VEEPVLIKITDFGLAKYIGNSKTGQINVPCGTPAYMAPEVLRGESYGPQVDNWSLGVILYILLCGYPPFYQDDSIEMYDHIQRGDFDFPSPHWDFISGEAKELVRKLLTVDPQERCSLSELLNDPWLLNQNSSKPSFGEDHEKRMNMMLKQHQMNKALEIVMVAKRRHRSCSMDSIEEPPSSTDSAMKQ